MYSHNMFTTYNNTQWSTMVANPHDLRRRIHWSNGFRNLTDSKTNYRFVKKSLPSSRIQWSSGASNLIDSKANYTQDPPYIKTLSLSTRNLYQSGAMSRSLKESLPSSRRIYGHAKYSKPAAYSPISRTFDTRDPWCEICSGGPEGDIFHFHVSTENERNKAKNMGAATYFCIICKNYHTCGTPATRNVVFTSSTLVNFWKDKAWKSSMHFDVEAIVGGTVQDGIRSFEHMYEGNPTPINAVIVYGINDILKGRSVENIVQDLTTFQQKLENHSIKYNHVELGFQKNSGPICPIIRPPKCVTFGRKYGLPTEDKTIQIELVNLEIKCLNESMGQKAPILMNLLGTRNSQDKTNHRFNQWREDETNRKLHLCSSLKCYAAKKIVEHFHLRAKK